MSTYKSAQLDPRTIPAAAEANEKVFGLGKVFGIEVTVPALAAWCALGNIDPQHSEGRPDRAAIEVAAGLYENCHLPPEGAVLVTIRPDLDVVGAMAIFAIRREPWGEDLLLSDDGGILERIIAIAEADRFAKGGWPGKKALPTRENPRLEESALAESSKPLAAIAAAVADFKIPLDQRVEWMIDWLKDGAEPDGYRNRVEKERTEMILALESGQIQVTEAANGKIAVVVSTHRSGTTIGYPVAPVVVALNPEFSFQGGPKHPKFTVCQFESGYVDLKAVVDELNALESGWSGSPTIIGSPQGAASSLTIEEVVKVVEKHLLK